MAGSLGELRKITKPNGDHIWNGFGTIEGLAGSFESQISDQQTNLDLKNVQTWEDDKEQGR